MFKWKPFLLNIYLNVSAVCKFQQKLKRLKVINEYTCPSTHAFAHPAHSKVGMEINKYLMLQSALGRKG